MAEGDGAGSPKLQRIGGGEPAHRGSRRREAGGAVTLDDLKTLLGQQSENIAESQARAIRGTVAELRAATAAEFQGIKSELSRHADYISQLRDQNERLEARMLAVESQKSEGSTVFPGSHGGDAGHQKNLVILGGWDADTHKADLLPELEELLDRIGVRAHAVSGYLHHGAEARACYGVGQVASGGERAGPQEAIDQACTGHQRSFDGIYIYAEWENFVGCS